jgi:hypothetical protein
VSQAVVVQPQLQLRARVLHYTLWQGTTDVALLAATRGAHLTVQATTTNGHRVPFLRATIQQGQPGSWRVRLGVGAAVPPGMYQLATTARLGNQTVRRTVRFVVASRATQGNRERPPSLS